MKSEKGLWNLAKESKEIYKDFDQYTPEERLEIAKEFLRLTRSQLNIKPRR